MGVLITVPFYNNNDTIERTLNNLFNQSYRDFEILIVNDCGEPLRSSYLGDPKIKYFELEKNMGRYFIDAIAVRANPHTYYLPHDADDVSDLDRLQLLVEQQQQFDADAVLNWQQVITTQGRLITEDYRLSNLTPDMRHIAHHSGLYKTKALKAIGGYHPDFRVGYDTLLVNLLLMRHRVNILEQRLYTRYLRPDSLTVSPKSNRHSPLRQDAIAKLRELYAKCYNDSGNIKKIVESSIDPETMNLVKAESKRLKQLWT